MHPSSRHTLSTASAILIQRQTKHGVHREWVKNVYIVILAFQNRDFANWSLHRSARMSTGGSPAISCQLVPAWYVWFTSASGGNPPLKSLQTKTINLCSDLVGW